MELIIEEMAFFGSEAEVATNNICNAIKHPVMVKLLDTTVYTN